MCKTTQKNQNDLDVEEVTYNRLFWRNVKPIIFLANTQKKEQIVSVEKNVVSEDSQSVEIFSIVKYLVYLVYLEILSLDIPREYKPELDDDPIINVIRTFEKHPSIRKIKGHMHTNSVFSFDYVIKEKLRKK